MRSLFLLFLLFSSTNSPAAERSDSVNDIVAQTIEKLLTRSQIAISENDQRPIEINLKIKQIEPSPQRGKFRVEDLAGSISIPLDDRIEIKRGRVRNRLLRSISPNITIEPIDDGSNLTLNIEKTNSLLRGSLSVVRVKDGIEYWSGVRINTKARLANYGTIMLQSVNFDFTDFEFDKSEAKFTGNCLIHMYIKDDLEKLDCQITGELDLVKMAYRVNVNISPVNTNPNCLPISKISERATEVLSEYQEKGLSFPSMYTLTPKIEMQASTMNGVPELSHKGFYEGFVRVGDGKFELIPGFRLDADTRTLIYICAKYDDENSEKPIATLYFLRLPSTDFSVLKFLKIADEDKRVVIASRNISFRPTGFLTSTISKIFSQIPVLKQLFSSFNKVVSFGEDQLIDAVINENFELGVNRLDITTKSLEFFYGARIFDNETEFSKKTIYFK